MARHQLFTLLITLVLQASVAIDIAGYDTVVDVTEHNKIDLDVASMEKHLKSGDFESAAVDYIEGGNSVKSSGSIRTIQGFSHGILGKAADIGSEEKNLMQEFFTAAAFHDDPRYADTFVMNALSDESLDPDARVQLALKGAQYQVVWMYVFYELYAALSVCLDGGSKPIAWDEGVAFYTGSLVGDGTGAFDGKLQFTLAEKRASGFGGANANTQAFLAFENGKEFVSAGDCDGIRRAIEVIKKQMVIPLLQGTLQYAQRVDPDVVEEPTEKYKAEAWAFAAAALPFVAEFSVVNATVIADNIDYFNPNATYDFVEVHQAVFDVLPALCMTCEDLGVASLEVMNSEKPGPPCTTQALPETCARNFVAVPDDADIAVQNTQGLFSFPAFFIVFREALEASIVCAVLLGIIKKTGESHLRRWVWIGLALGLLVTLAALIGLVVVFSLIKGDASFRDRLLLQGSLSTCAAVLIAYLALTIGGLMEKHERISNRIEERIEEEDESFGWRTVFFLSFTAISREGIETVVFLGVGSNFEGQALPIPILVGTIMGVGCGLALYRAGSKMAIRVFFQFTIVLLVFIGAGIFAHAIAEFQVVFDYGEWWEAVVYNVSRCCSLRFEFWGMVRALFGWTPYPSRLELLCYFLYHIVLWSLLLLKYVFNKYDIHPWTSLKAYCCGRNSDSRVQSSEAEKMPKAQDEATLADKAPEANVDLVLA